MLRGSIGPKSSSIHHAPASSAPARTSARTISRVVEGGLAHLDNTGGAGVLGPGVLPWVGAGHGIEQNEFNTSKEDRLSTRTNYRHSCASHTHSSAITNK